MGLDRWPSLVMIQQHRWIVVPWIGLPKAAMYGVVMLRTPATCATVPIDRHIEGRGIARPADTPLLALTSIFCPAGPFAGVQMKRTKGISDGPDR